MYLVTGGAGFIGSVLVALLNRKGIDKIIIVDRLRDTTKWLNLRGLKYTAYIHSDDLFKPEHDQLLDEVDGIFHLGACSSTWEMNSDYLMQNNVEYSKKLFQMSLDKNIPFVYASSAATYGAGEHGFSDEHKKCEHLVPINPYGYSKFLFDEWVLNQKLQPKLWYGVKFFNVYGPNEYHKGDMRSLVHKAFLQIKESGTVRLFKSHKEGFKDGEQLRDFIYVVDAAAALIEFMDNKKTNASGIYNLGTGKARSFKDLTLATFKALNQDAKIEFVDMPEKIRGQYQYFTEAKMTKFFTYFPRFQFRTLEEGVSDYVTNYLMKESPYFRGRKDV